MVAIKDMEMPKSCYECDLHNYHNCDLTNDGIEKYLDDVKHPNCPLVEIEERKVGKWIKEEDTLGWDGHSYQCSVCGRSIHLDVEVEDLSDYPYCHCGVEMEIDEDGKWIDD